LTLRRVYLGNMSGDTVRVGLALASRDWIELLIRASPILSFGAGLLVGALIQDVASDGHRLSRVARKSCGARTAPSCGRARCPRTLDVRPSTISPPDVRPAICV